VLKKQIQYKDLDGNTVQETFYFHYNQAELAKLRLMYGDADGDVAAHFTRLLQGGDRKAIIDAFDGLILGAYGQRSVDGKRFEKKNGELAAEFQETEAYSALFIELVSDGGKNFAAFLQGVLPSDLQEKLDANADLKERIGIATDRIQNGDVELQERLKNRVEEIVAEKEATSTTDLRPAWMRENRDPTQEEMLKMSPSEFSELVKRRSTTQ
jgi:hypothetical protein